MSAAASPSNPVLTPEQLEHLEQRLLHERRRSLRALGLWEEQSRADREDADSELTVYRDHMADQGTEAMEREKAALFATKEGRYLYRLEEALHRLRTSPETFGLCHATGKPIGFERLDALPHARYCIEHKRSLEAAS